MSNHILTQHANVSIPNSGDSISGERKISDVPTLNSIEFSLEKVFCQLQAGLSAVLPSSNSVSSQLLMPGLPAEIAQGKQYQQILRHYLNRGFQPTLIDQQNRLAFSQKLYSLLLQMQAEATQNALGQLQDCGPLEAQFPPPCFQWDWQKTRQILNLAQQQHRLLIFSANSQPLDTIPGFLAQNGLISAAVESSSPIEYHADYFPGALDFSGISQAQKVFGTMPTVIISSQINDQCVNLQVIFWTSCDPETACISLPVPGWTDSISTLYELVIAFVIDWYYLQINLLYQPKLPDLVQAFSQEWIQAALLPLKSLYQRNQAIVFSLQGNQSAELGLWENAIANYEIALELNPDFIDVAVAKGIARYQVGHYEQAILLLNKALHNPIEFPEALHYKDMALAKMGRTIEEASHCLHFF